MRKGGRDCHARCGRGPAGHLASSIVGGRGFDIARNSRSAHSLNRIKAGCKLELDVAGVAEVVFPPRWQALMRKARIFA